MLLPAGTEAALAGVDEVGVVLPVLALEKRPPSELVLATPLMSDVLLVATLLLPPSTPVACDEPLALPTVTRVRSADEELEPLVEPEPPGSRARPSRL